MNKIGRLRISTAIGYLSAARARPNLRISANTLTRRLLVEHGGVVGVEVERDGQFETIRGRVIVLSAGAIQSPAILLRSGIGPRAEVERHGITLVRETPGVGASFSDHPALAVAATVKDPALLDPDQPIVQTILRYTAPGSDQRNDLQIEAFSFSPRSGSLSAFAVAAVLEQANSKGTLTLASADPHDAPLIRQNMLTDERDMTRLMGCFRDCMTFMDTGPMAGLIDRVIFPTAERELSDAALRGLLSRFAASGFHPCATAKMGPATDPLAVVDQYGRAHGIEGLVVADASIMPTVPRANTNLTTIMIGEMVGEWLRTQPGLYGL